MSIEDMTLPQLKLDLEVTSYEMWGGYSELGIAVMPFLGRERWCCGLEEEIERREWQEKYPEHAKLDAIPLEQRNAIGGFIEWLGDYNYSICETYSYDYVDLGTNPERWVAAYFNIDQEALSKEKDEMYREIRQGG